MRKFKRARNLKGRASCRGRYFTFALFALATLITLHAHAGSRRWVDRSSGILDLDIQTIDVCVQSPARVLCASRTTVYLSEDHGRSWKSVFRIPSRKKRSMTIESEDISREEFSRDDYDENDLYREGILLPGEQLDDISDSELYDRLEREGLLLEKKETVRESFEEKKGWKQGISCIRWDPTRAGFAYIGSSDGVYLSEDGGRSWRKARAFFRGKQRNVLSLAVCSPSGWVLMGTEQGLFFSTDHVDTIQLVPGTLSNKKYLDVVRDEFTQNGFMACSERDVFWGVLPASVHRYPVSSGRVRGILAAVAVGEGERLFAVTKFRVREHLENDSWDVIANVLLSGSEIRDCLWMEKTLLLASSRGVFSYRPDTGDGTFVNDGLTELDIRELARGSGNKDFAWVATRSGVFAWERVSESEMMRKSIRWDAREMMKIPPVDELLAAAARYAEIHPKFSTSPFRRVKQAGYLPDVELNFQLADKSGYDYGRGKNISISGGAVTTGVDDEDWTSNSKDWLKVECRLRWYPGEYLNIMDRLMIHETIKKDNRRFRKLAAKVRQLFAKIAHSVWEYNNRSFTSQKEKIELRLQIERMIAEMESLTGLPLWEMAAEAWTADG